MGRRVFVRKLAPRTKKNKLLEIFLPYEAEHAVVLRRSTGYHTFIMFRTEEGAGQALEAGSLGIVCQGRRLKVSPADPWHEAKHITTACRASPSEGQSITGEPVTIRNDDENISVPTLRGSIQTGIDVKVVATWKSRFLYRYPTSGFQRLVLAMQMGREKGDHENILLVN